MTLTVRFQGPIRRPWPEAERLVTVKGGSTVADVLVALGFPRQQHAFLQAARNGVSSRLTAPVEEGDLVEVMLRVGGG